MRITTELNLEDRTATVTIHTEEKSFTMTYELDKITKELDTLTSNWFAQKTLELLGFKIEVHKTHVDDKERVEMSKSESVP